jgi:hypothetical protein
MLQVFYLNVAYVAVTTQCCSKSFMLQMFHEAQEVGAGGAHGAVRAGVQQGEQGASELRARSRAMSRSSSRRRLEI